MEFQYRMAVQPILADELLRTKREVLLDGLAKYDRQLDLVRLGPRGRSSGAARALHAAAVDPRLGSSPHQVVAIAVLCQERGVRLLLANLCLRLAHLDLAHREPRAQAVACLDDAQYVALARVEVVPIALASACKAAERALHLLRKVAEQRVPPLLLPLSSPRSRSAAREELVPHLLNRQRGSPGSERVKGECCV